MVGTGGEAGEDPAWYPEEYVKEVPVHYYIFYLFRFCYFMSIAGKISLVSGLVSG